MMTSLLRPSEIPALLRIVQEWDLDGKAAMITVRGVGATVSIAIKDRTQPLPIDAVDKQLMEMVARAMISLGVSEGRLQRRDARYALFAIAQHIKASLGAVAPQIPFGGLTLPARTTMGAQLAVRVEEN